MELISGKPLKSIWLKAAVAGSIWASIEIIFGSFLHNLKIPLSGMFLSFIGVWLMISFLQVWKESGLIWRAGLICALMKSISPSAFILGPMIGIFTEALLIELFIFLLGKNLAGYIAGGAFAVLETIIHKLISLLILYGFNFIKILSDLYNFALKQIHLEHVNPFYLIGIITAIYITAGTTGALLGYFTGLKYLSKRTASRGKINVSLSTGNPLFNQVQGQSYSLILLLINLLSIAIILFLLNYDLLFAAAFSSIAYLLFCITKYKNAMKRLKKLSFWISFLIITFTAAFLWDGFSNGAFFTINGLITGLKMNARAVIIILGFASISVELKNPVIKSVLYHKGFANLYQSLSLSFSALPNIISSLSKSGNKANAIPAISFQGLFSQAETLLAVFEKEDLQKPQIVIITGDIHQGKTTFTRSIVNTLGDNKIRISGFLSLGIDENHKRTGFYLYDIESGEKIELCSEKKDNDRINYGQFYFNREAIVKGQEILKVENLIDKQLIVIDEIGPLELRNDGWNSSLEIICRKISIPHLWVVRRSIIKEVSRKWNVGNVYIYDIETDEMADVVNKLMEIISARQTTS
jgi:nucleoside-triphosphatase THEP1